LSPPPSVACLSSVSCVLYNPLRNAVMNALEFVFTPHNYLPSNLPFPFTIPATSSSLVAASSDVATFTTSVATITTETALILDVAPTYSAPAPLGFLLYIVAQLQKILASGLTGGTLFGGPTRSYWILTLFMVSSSGPI
jgi:hypothetical protein